MRSIIQRVSKASVQIKGKTVGKINQGFLILVGVEDADTHEDVKWLTEKICKLRVFDDAQGKMNLNIQDIKGNVLVVSQFTLHAQIKKGNRPSYIKAAKPPHAIKLYEDFIDALFLLLDQPVQSGEFGANMQVELINDGPVTLMIDSKNKE